MKSSSASSRKRATMRSILSRSTSFPLRLSPISSLQQPTAKPHAEPGAPTASSGSICAPFSSPTPNALPIPLPQQLFSPSIRPLVAPLVAHLGPPHHRSSSLRLFVHQHPSERTSTGWTIIGTNLRQRTNSWAKIQRKRATVVSVRSQTLKEAGERDAQPVFLMARLS